MCDSRISIIQIQMVYANFWKLELRIFPFSDSLKQWRSQPDIWSCKCKFFCVYKPYKESVSKEMNNDSDLNLQLHDQMSGWLRYCSKNLFISKTKYGGCMDIENHIDL